MILGNKADGGFKDLKAFAGKSQAVIDRHREALQDKNRQVREQATTYLVTADPTLPELLPALIKLLRIEKPEEGASGGGGFGPWLESGAIGYFGEDVRVPPLRNIAKIGEKPGLAVSTSSNCWRTRNLVQRSTLTVIIDRQGGGRHHPGQHRPRCQSRCAGAQGTTEPRRSAGP